MRLFRRSLLILLALPIVLLAIAWLAAQWREDDAQVPPGTHLVATPLGRIAAAVQGPAGGSPVLIVAGTAGWSGFWRDVARHLAARGHRVIAADLPPFGYADRDPDGRYDRTSQATRLAALVRAAGGGRPAIVVAHSFGAGAATELALRHPRQVARLVLVDAALGTLDPPSGAPGLATRALGQRWIAEPLVAATMTNPLALGPLLRGMLAHKDAAAPWVDTLATPMRRPGTTAAYARWLPALFVADDGALSRRSRALAAIRPPVAIIWGTADTVTPIAQGEALARLMRARTFTRLAGAGHIPHIEVPAPFLAALDRAMEGAR